MSIILIPPADNSKMYAPPATHKNPTACLTTLLEASGQAGGP